MLIALGATAIADLVMSIIYCRQSGGGVIGMFIFVWALLYGLTIWLIVVSEKHAKICE